MAVMDGESIRVTRSVSIPLSEIQLRFSRSSGPGGQHAQKSETRVEALFDVEASASLSPHQKSRVLRKTGPVLRAIAQDERSQARNRELAVERVADAVARGIEDQAPPRADEAVGQGEATAPRHETQARRDEAPPPAPS